MFEKRLCKDGILLRLVFGGSIGIADDNDFHFILPIVLLLLNLLLLLLLLLEGESGCGVGDVLVGHEKHDNDEEEFELFENFHPNIKFFIDIINKGS